MLDRSRRVVAPLARTSDRDVVTTTRSSVGNDEDELPAVAPRVITVVAGELANPEAVAVFAIAAPARSAARRSCVLVDPRLRNHLAIADAAVVQVQLAETRPSAAASSASRCRRNRCLADPAVHFASVKPSGFASSSCANCHVLIFAALVRIADSRCELPVLYSTRVPGSSISGRAQHEAHPVRALHPRAVVRGRWSTPAPIASSADPRW